MRGEVVSERESEKSIEVGMESSVSQVKTGTPSSFEILRLETTEKQHLGMSPVS